MSILGEAVVSCYADAVAFLVAMLLLLLSEPVRGRESDSLRIFFLLLQLSVPSPVPAFEVPSASKADQKIVEQVHDAALQESTEPSEDSEDGLPRDDQAPADPSQPQDDQAPADPSQPRETPDDTLGRLGWLKS